MNLYNSDDTRCEREKELKDVCGHNPDELWLEMKQLRKGSMFEKVEEKKPEMWIWKNASPSLKKIIVEEENVNWESLETRIECLVRRERRTRK